MSALPDQPADLPGPGALWIDHSTGSSIPRRNRRANVRVRLRRPLTVYQGLGEERVVVPGRMRDLSVRGMNFASRLELRQGDRAMVDLEFDDWTFRVRLIVRFAKPIVAGTQVGCEFTDLTLADGERISAELYRLNAERARVRLRSV